MPEMDAYEATGKFRRLSLKDKSNVPIVALTASAVKEVGKDVFAPGINIYLRKLFTPPELQKKLDVIC